MGHVRLGDLPRTRKWQEVVGLIEGGAGTAQTANAMMTAAERGLNLASEDKGLVGGCGPHQRRCRGEHRCFRLHFLNRFPGQSWI